MSKKILDLSTLQGCSVVSEGRRYTGHQLTESIRHIQEQMRSLGVEQGARCVLLGKPSAGILSMLLALLESGYCALVLDPDASQEDLARQLTLAAPHIVISEQSQLPGNGSWQRLQVDLDAQKMHPRQMSVFRTLNDPLSSGEACAMMVFSSGTGGSERLIMHNAASIKAVVDFYSQAFRDEQLSRLLMLLPLSAIYATSISLATLIAGGTLVIADPGKDDVATLISQYNVDVLPAVPLILDRIHQNIFEQVHSLAPWKQRLALTLLSLCRSWRMCGLGNLGRLLFRSVHVRVGSSLKLILSGGATLAQRTLIDLYALGFTVYEGYGLTETAGLLTMRRSDPAAFGSCGHPVADVEIRLAETNQEVLVRSPRMFLGYFDGTHGITPCDRTTWFPTGDVGHWDDAGNLRVAGRIKDVIIAADESKHLPDVLEQLYASALGAHPFVVVGVPETEQSGDLFCVVVENSDPTLARSLAIQLRKHSATLPPALCPHRVYCHPRIPRNKLGKVKRAVLVQDLKKMEHVVV